MSAMRMRAVDQINKKAAELVKETTHIVKPKKRLVFKKKVCVKCSLLECCCEADRLQVIKDDEAAKLAGFEPQEIKGEIRWVKPAEEAVLYSTENIIEFIKNRKYSVKATEIAKYFKTDKHIINKGTKDVKGLYTLREEKIIHISRIDGAWWKFGRDDKREAALLKIKQDQEARNPKVSEESKKELIDTKDFKVGQIYITTNKYSFIPIGVKIVGVKPKTLIYTDLNNIRVNTGEKHNIALKDYWYNLTFSDPECPNEYSIKKYDACKWKLFDGEPIRYKEYENMN